MNDFELEVISVVGRFADDTKIFRMVKKTGCLTVTDDLLSSHLCIHTHGTSAPALDPTDRLYKLQRRFLCPFCAGVPPCILMGPGHPASEEAVHELKPEN